MPDPLLYLKAMSIAAIVSATFVLAMVFIKKPASTTRRNCACVVGIGLGLVVGYSVLSLRLVWPPANGLDRFLTIVVPATLVVELIAGFSCVPRWLAWFLRISLAASIPRIILHGSVYLSGSAAEWLPWQISAGLVMSVALLAGVWCLLSRLFQRSPGVSIPLALCLTIQCVGMTIMMAGYIKGGAAALPLSATLLATTLASATTKRSDVLANFGASALIGIGVLELFGLLLVGRSFGRLSTGCVLAMLLTPLLCWASEIPPLRHRKPWLVGSFRLAMVAIPLLVVLVVAKQTFDRDMRPLLGSMVERSQQLHAHTNAQQPDERLGRLEHRGALYPSSHRTRRAPRWSQDLGANCPATVSATSLVRWRTELVGLKICARDRAQFGEAFFRNRS